MTCSSCDHENVSGAQFCAQCGARLDGPVQASPYRPFESGQLGQPRGDIPPREIAGLLSEALGVYSTSFWPFALIAAVSFVPSIISMATPSWLTVILFIFGLLLTLLAYPAIAFGVVLSYLGREVDVALCYRRAWNRVVSFLIAYLIVVAALMGCVILAFIAIGIPLFFYILVSWFFFSVAIILEGKGPTAAIQRSRELVSGSWWRIFGIGVVFVLLTLVLDLGALMIAGIVGRANSIAGEVFGNVLLIFVSPIAPIGATLVYFDLRVRKEGYNLDTMATEVGVAPSGV